MRSESYLYHNYKMLLDQPQSGHLGVSAHYDMEVIKLEMQQIELMEARALDSQVLCTA